MTEDKRRGTHQPGRTTGTSQREPEVLASPVLTFDLEEELRRLHGEDAWRRGERNSRTLVHEPDFRLVLIALKRGGGLEEHRAPGRISVQALRGHVRLSLPERTVELPAGQLLALEPDIPHDVEALEESALLLTIAWAGRGKAASAEKGTGG